MEFNVIISYDEENKKVGFKLQDWKEPVVIGFSSEWSGLKVFAIDHRELKDLIVSELKRRHSSDTE